MDFLGNGVEFVERLQARGDTENSCIVFDHVKRFKDWTTMACHVYDIKYCKVMTIACCDMQSKDDTIQILLRERLNFFIVEDEVLNMNFKDFMMNSAWTISIVSGR